MRKLLFILLTFCLSILLSACGESQAEKEQRMYEEAARGLKESQSRIDELERETRELEAIQKAIGY